MDDNFEAVLLPNNQQAEAALISTCLSHPRQFEKVKDTLERVDFYNDCHGTAWAAMQEISADGLQVGPITLADRLDRMHALDNFMAYGSNEATGTSAIANIMASDRANVRDIDTLVAIIKNLSGKRRIFYTLQSHIAPTVNGKPAGEIIQSLTRELGEIELETGNHASEILTTRQALDRTMAYTDSVAAGRSPAIPTGLIDLDKYLGGWRQGNYITVAGRPGEGKTSLILKTAWIAALKHGKRVGIFSLEMGVEEIFNRIISQMTNIPGELIRDGKMHDNQWPTYADALGTLESATFHVCEAPALDIPKLRTFSRKMAYMGLDMLCVDYIGLMTDGTPRRQENRVQEISNISRTMKALARELKIPVICAAQMNRAIDARADKEPMLSDLRESGSIEQDSDIVIFVHHKNQDDRSRATLKIAKHRNGKVGSVDVFFNETTTDFANMARV